MDESGRCLLDCLCKDEMKCCKSVPQVATSLHRASRTLADSRCLTSPSQLTTAGRHSDGEGEEEDPGDARRAHRSLPDMAARSALGDDDASRRRLRSPPTSPSDTLVQVIRLLLALSWSMLPLFTGRGSRAVARPVNHGCHSGQR